MAKMAKKPEQTDPGPSTQLTQSTKSGLSPRAFGKNGAPDFVGCVVVSIASKLGCGDDGCEGPPNRDFLKCRVEDSSNAGLKTPQMPDCN